MLLRATDNEVEQKKQETTKSQFVAKDPDLFSKLRQSVFTTGDLQIIFRNSLKIIARHIDTGIIKGHKIPGSRHRRVFARDAHAFLKENGMANLVKPPVEIRLLKEGTQYEEEENNLPIVYCKDACDLGMKIYETNPKVIVLDRAILGHETHNTAARIVDVFEKHHCDVPKIHVVSNPKERQLRLFKD